MSDLDVVSDLALVLVISIPVGLLFGVFGYLIRRGGRR